uniref:Pseudouridylate synthase 1 homolog n=1 Tax=Ciona savignyi TaxID=51511 RepID=H2YLR8_CIOSA
MNCFSILARFTKLRKNYITKAIPSIHLHSFNSTMDSHDSPSKGNAENKDEPEGSVSQSDLVSGPKRKVAMLFAYCGANYHGLQMNRGDRSIKTVEGALFQALVDAKVVPFNCVEEPHKMTYKSASRTDKGVSTCGQVASLKLRVNEKVVELINQHLPEDIVVLAVRRTTQGFNAQMKADGRTYSYTLPTFAFADYGMHSVDYRVTEDKLATLRSILFRYQGTHSFHNFTSGKRMGDMSANRFIISFEHGKPFLVRGVEFITLTVKGQSFMIHQIRKMVGMAIAMVNKLASEEHLVRAFSQPLEDIPKAPGTGLVLEKVHYERFNKGPAKQHGGIVFDDVQDQVDEFRKTRIFPYIYKEEIENSSMLDWLDTLSRHDYTGKSSREQWELQVKEWNLKKERESEKSQNNDNNDVEVISDENKSSSPPCDNNCSEISPLDGVSEKSIVNNVHCLVNKEVADNVSDVDVTSEPALKKAKTFVT